MSFRKRNVIVATPGSSTGASSLKAAASLFVPGVRPSPLDGRPTTSTGTRSFDAILAGHAGMALGTSILLQEEGTTDFGGALIRYYAAEGVLQGHHVHVLGMHDGWARELPGLGSGEEKSRKSTTSSSEDKMKIAWRYERLGEFGRDRAAPQALNVQSLDPSTPVFCHDFDLSKRLALPASSHIKCVSLNAPPSSLPVKSQTASPFDGFLRYLQIQITSTPPQSIHRILVPNILSPAIYPPEAANPTYILQFLHVLRALLRRYPTQLSAVLTLPLSLYPRATGLTKMMETVSDGVLEIAPFPSNSMPVNVSGTSGSQEEPPQGLLKVHRLPIFHEKGGGGGDPSGLGEDLAFNLSRRKGLVIKPYNLPPVEGDSEAQEQGLTTDQGEKATKIDIEF